MMIDDNILLQRLRDEVGVPAGEDERLTVKLAAAKRYVAHAVGTATVDDDLLADCIVSCAADLFNMRDASPGRDGRGRFDCGTVQDLHRPAPLGLAETPRRRRAHRGHGDCMNIQEQRAALMNTLTNMLDGLVSSVSIDAQLIRPAAGKVAVFIEPPTVEWPSWGPPEPVWTLDVIAGTPATQPSAVDDILTALDRLAERGLNIQKATPATWNLAGAGTLAAYQVVLNALETE